MNKYIHLKDVDTEIKKILDYIDSLNIDLLFNLKRVKYLEVLFDYLMNDGLVPYGSKTLLKDNVKLQEFVAPLMCKKDKNELEYYNVYDVGKTYKLIKAFVNFCCEIKGHKIGIGDFLIEKFIKEKVVFGNE